MVATVATKPYFLVAKEKMLVALVTVSVAISSPLLRITIKQFCFTRGKNNYRKTFSHAYKKGLKNFSFL